MTITMIAGSFIGGATAEGGGAVAFPVMTLVLHATPAVARDYSFMIQCCGRLKMSYYRNNNINCDLKVTEPGWEFTKLLRANS